MGNTPSAIEEKNLNSITVIRTEGKDVSGISFIYNREDEEKIINKIKERLNTQTEMYIKPEVSEVEQELRSIQEQDEDEDELDPELEAMLNEPVPKAFNEQEIKKIFKRIEDILESRSETYSPMNE
jgi:acetolactate synthase small subunit